MKTNYLSIITFGLSLLSFHPVKAQGQVFDIVSIGAGYTNQSFYSMSNGEVSNVINTNWDLAFQISGFQASILVNGKNNVRLFRSGLDVNAWPSVTANDTIGKLNPSFELHNQDTSWWAGAFNITNDTSNPFDLGWGVYDFVTHAVTGDSLYFIKLANGNVQKLWIQALQNGTYLFAYADVDGTNEVNASLNKTNFGGKNFGYYSMVNNTTIDREPNKYLWDLTFMQYMSTTPILYKVTGILANDSVSTVKAYPVDEATVTPWGLSFSYYINNIGYSWKNYDFNNNAWAIEDSTVFFVNDRQGLLWKLVFTGFGGAATGNYEFYKEQVSATGIAENGGYPSLLNLYPNPASEVVQVTVYTHRGEAGSIIRLLDATGRQVREITIPEVTGLQNIQVPVSGLAAGLYRVQVVAEGAVTTRSVAVTR